MYEKGAPETKEFKSLQNKIKDGENLQIIGYDAYPITHSLQEHYEDETRPFGHELVLFSLLVLDDPKEYPWNVFYQKNIHIYQS